MLKVERIILKGFTGMGLHEIAKFDFTVASPVTVILGGNGCGKSSLLAVYLPLCPAKTDLKDGGDYTNFCLVGDTRYKFHVRRKGNSLICSIDNMTKNETVVEDVNPKVYNSHVESITGLTKEIKEMLNGETLLTRANSNLRKQWFTKLSTTDMSYALGFYTKIRKHYTALGNQIDYVGEKIADSKNKVVDDKEARDRIFNRMEDMQLEISALNKVLENRPATNSAISAQSIELKMQRMSKVVNLILNGDVILPTPEMIEHEQAQLILAREWVASGEATTTTYTKELSLLMDEQNRQEYLMRNHTGLKETIERLHGELLEMRQVRRAFIDLFDTSKFNTQTLQQAVTYSHEFTTSLTQSVERLKTNARLRSHEDALREYDAKATINHENVVRCENVIREYEHAKTHYLETSEVNCPSCNYQFRPGVSKSIESIEQELSLQYEHLSNLKAVQETLIRERSEVEDEVVLLRTIRDIVMTYSKDPVLVILFKRFQEEDAFGENRARFGGLVAAFFEDIEQAMLYHRLSAAYEKAQQEWKTAAAVVGNVDTVLPDQIARLKGRLEESSQKLSNARRFAQEKNDTVAQLTTLKTSIDAFNAYYEDLQHDMIISSNNVAVGTLLQVREDKLDAYATARDRYRQMTAELDMLAGLEADLEVLKAKRHATKLMMYAWSPETGVLRKYFYKAIVRITDLMTKYIDHVWSYSMQVLPCDMSDGDLDYLFSVRLKDFDDLVPDVSKGSKAQQVMFNLAYRLTGYKALGLHQYPLLLDEPSEGMDELHRDRLVIFIKRLMASGEFSQLIIVSHESDVHSKLNEAEYCVVEPEGVTLPEVYNTHVKIEYVN